MEVIKFLLSIEPYKKLDCKPVIEEDTIVFALMNKKFAAMEYLMSQVTEVDMAYDIKLEVGLTFRSSLPSVPSTRPALPLHYSLISPLLFSSLVLQFYVLGYIGDSTLLHMPSRPLPP